MQRSRSRLLAVPLILAMFAVIMQTVLAELSLSGDVAFAAAGSDSSRQQKMLRRSNAKEGDDVAVYFGQGCFWHVQYELVTLEQNALKREPNAITALTGYAGGTGKSSDGYVCYHGDDVGDSDYGKLGHSEVVQVQIPTEAVGVFAKEILSQADGFEFGRHDPQDRGGEYRSAIGVPGGLDGPLREELKKAVEGTDMVLVKGSGDDGDTLNTKKVWVYDSHEFPFFQAEMYHQFHNDMSEIYPLAYHGIKDEMLESGAIKETGCPEKGTNYLPKKPSS